MLHQSRQCVAILRRLAWLAGSKGKIRAQGEI